MFYKTALVIQATKAPGKENLGEIAFKEYARLSLPSKGLR